MLLCVTVHNAVFKAWELKGEQMISILLLRSSALQLELLGWDSRHIFCKKTYMRNVFFTLFALRFFSFFVLSGDQRCNRTHKWRPCPHIQCLQSGLGDFLWSELISILTWVKAGVWSSQKMFSGFFLKIIIAVILTNWVGCFALDCSKQESPDLNKNPILPSLTTPNSCGSHTSVTS